MRIAQILLLLCWENGATVFAGAILIPTPGAGTEGNTFAQQPFSLEDLAIPSSRYQQVYNASEFTSQLPVGGFITDIYFRSDGGVGRFFSTFLPEVQIDMALTARNANGLSTTFDDNITASLQVVYPRGGLRFQSSGAGQEARITLADPYFYNPTSGNLLLQIRNFQQTPLPNSPDNRAGPLDAQNSVGDTVSRVFANDANAMSGTADSIGLVTFFAVNPVPEPSTISLTLLGICLFWLCAARTKRQT